MLGLRNSRPTLEDWEYFWPVPYILDRANCNASRLPETENGMPRYTGLLPMRKFSVKIIKLSTL